MTPALVAAAILAWLTVTVWMVLLIVDEVRARRAQRRRRQQVTDDAIRYLEQRQLQLKVRDLVDDERRRQLQAAAHPEPRA